MSEVNSNHDEIKMWWAGDPRVEKHMKRVRDALDRSGLDGQKRTDVYNRAYEAVYYAILETAKAKSIGNALAEPIEEWKP